MKVILALTWLWITLCAAGHANAACGGDCDATYSSDAEHCHLQYGDDPNDAEDPASCIQDARDSYDTCLNSCSR